MKLNRKEDGRRLEVDKSETGDGVTLRESKRSRNEYGRNRWNADVIELSREELERIVEWATKFLQDSSEI